MNQMIAVKQYFLVTNNSLLRLNHKIIGLNYIILSLYMSITGLCLSIIFKLELKSSGAKILSLANSNMYNLYISLHGIIMVFLVLTPLLFIGITYYLFPLIVNISTFKLINMSYVNLYNLVLAFLLAIYSLLSEFNIIYGWTLYTPLNLYSSVNLIYIISAIILIAIVMLTISVEYLLVPSNYNNIFIFSIYITALMIVLVWPVLFSISLLLLYDVYFTNSLFIIFQDPILYQHIFWYFGHPEVYILIIPSFGIINQALGQINNSINIVSLICLGILGNVVFGHHMFTVGLDIDNLVYFSIMSNVIALPTSHKIINWIYILKSNSKYYNNVYYLVVSFIILFLFGTLTGMLLGNSTLDIVLHDTFFIISHFHFIIAVGSLMTVLLSFVYVFNYNISVLSVQILFILSVLIFMPLHIMGLNLFPRRVYNYCDYINNLSYLSSLATVSLLTSLVLFNCSKNIKAL